MSKSLRLFFISGWGGVQMESACVSLLLQSLSGQSWTSSDQELVESQPEREWFLL